MMLLLFDEIKKSAVQGLAADHHELRFASNLFDGSNPQFSCAVREMRTECRHSPGLAVNAFAPAEAPSQAASAG
jgi:hypothetical protein